MPRLDGRAPDEMRPVQLQTGYLAHAEGSVLIDLGGTQVLCAVSVEERVPPFLRGRGRGWVTAEYAMLPRSTNTRTPRESTQGRVGGRTHEIQRLIGRSLRAVTDMAALGERTFQVDCDVLRADGGTRTAAITGSYVALYQAMHGLVARGVLSAVPLFQAVAATSVGQLAGERLIDLCYEEDSQADADFNVVMTADGSFIEVQGTAERQPFARADVDAVLDLAAKGISELLTLQQNALAAFA